ncbi:MAG: hypothetical protein ACRDQF_17475, partial [Thermocrispum sp.]
MARTLALLCAAGLLLSACTDTAGGGPDDPLQVTDNPVAATPARSPATAQKPAGTVRDGKPPEQMGRTAQLGERTLIARGKAGIEVRRDGKRERMIKGELAGADQVFVVDGHAAVLDRVRSAVFQV